MQKHQIRELARLTANHLARLSGIPHVNKINVDDEALVQIMIGLQLNAEEERREIEQRSLVLYDPQYLSGLVELTSPTHSTTDTSVSRWPCTSHKGRKQRKMEIMEKVVEEPELGHYSRTSAYAAGVDEVIFEAASEISVDISPRQSIARDCAFRAAAQPLYPRHAINTRFDMVDAFPVVPDTACSMPGLSDGSTYSLQSVATSFAELDAHDACRRSLRRVQSESSMYSIAAQQHKPSLHLYSPWLEEIDASFGLRSKQSMENMPDRGLIPKQHKDSLRSVPCMDALMPMVMADQKMSTTTTPLGRYRTTRL